MARARVFYYSYTVLDCPPPDTPEGPVKIQYDQNHQHFILSWNSPSKTSTDDTDLNYLVEMEFEPNSWIVLGQSKEPYIKIIPNNNAYHHYWSNTSTSLKKSRFRIFAQNHLGMSPPLRVDDVSWPNISSEFVNEEEVLLFEDSK